MKKEQEADESLNIYLFIKQVAQINFEDRRFSILNIEFPKYPHPAVVCGQTGCGKTFCALDLLEKEYQGVFKKIVMLCPTMEWNKAYKTRSWIGDVRRPKDKSIIIVHPVMRDETERLQELLRYFFYKFEGRPTLYIIDDCSATKKN